MEHALLYYWCLLEEAISHLRSRVHRYEKIHVSTAVEAKVNGPQYSSVGTSTTALQYQPQHYGTTSSVGTSTIALRYNQFRRYINHSITISTIALQYQPVQ